MSLLLAKPESALPIDRVLGGTAVAASRASAHGASCRSPVGGRVRALCQPAFARAFPADAAGRRAQIIADAVRFTGVPYLWGGCSAFGIDCSGYAQLLHRLAGVTIPRDADKQFDAVAPSSRPTPPATCSSSAMARRRARSPTSP